MSNNAGESGQESGQQQGSQGQESGNQNGNQGQESGAGGQQGIDPTTITDPTLRAYVEAQVKQAQEARQEAARYRTERNAFQTQVQQAQRANETDEQRRQREQTERDERVQKLEQENRDLKVGTVVKGAADKAKAFNSQVVYDMVKDKVVLDESGTPANVADLIADLKREHPYLFKRANANAGEGGGQGNQAGQTMNDAIRAAARGTQLQ